MGVASRLHESRVDFTVARLRLQRANSGEWPREREEVGMGKFQGLGSDLDLLVWV